MYYAIGLYKVKNLEEEDPKDKKKQKNNKKDNNGKSRMAGAIVGRIRREMKNKKEHMTLSVM